MGDGAVRQAVAFASSHITGVFEPVLTSRDPRGRGSVGAGIVLDVGVRAFARFRPGRRGELRLTSDVGRRLEISEDAAARLLGPRPGRLEIHLTHGLPIGQGFGSSAAGALATALAVARLLGRERREAISIAHLADLFGRGGLGGVAAILGGGLEVRRRAGIPPYGEVSHYPVSAAILLGTIGGPLPSPGVLGSRRALARIRLAAEELEGFGAHPTIEEFLDRSEAFTDRVRLASPRLRTTLQSLRRRGAWAAQAMFGRSFFAIPRTSGARREVIRWMIAHDLRVVEVGVARSGPRVSSLSAEFASRRERGRASRTGAPQGF